MMSAIKSGAVSHSRFAKMAEMDYKVSNNIALKLSLISQLFELLFMILRDYSEIGTLHTCWVG